MRTFEELVHGLERDGIEHVVERAGSAWMVVAPPLGARILGAGVDGENLLWTAPSFSARGWSEGGNSGGARTWLAPEGGPRGFFCSEDFTRWNVPREIDPGQYASCPAGSGWLSFRSAFTARAADGASFPVEITRSMRIEKVAEDRTSGGATSARILFRHELRNAGSAPIDRRVGLWCIVQVPSEAPGTIIVPLAGGAPQGRVRPYFTRLPEGILRLFGSAALLKAHGGLRYKIGVHARAAVGRIAFLRPTRTDPSRWSFLCLSFPVDPQGTYLDGPWAGEGAVPDGGDAVQAYNDAGTGDLAFSEIEAHAPSVRLGPGELQSFEIEMALKVTPQPPLAALGMRAWLPDFAPEMLFPG